MKSTFIQDARHARICHILLMALFGPAFSFPTSSSIAIHAESHADTTTTTEQYIVRIITVCILVVMGGFFAGLTLGLMGLDETNLQVMVQSGSESEKENAIRVLGLLNKGKYWVLVTLLLSNVIVNETLPIVLDSILGGGWLAVLLSTALIVIFGEVIPQSICVRYGLAIGAKCSPIVLVIMYMMYPVAYPTSYLLRYFLGESHGLKTLVSLHQSDDDIEGLTEDEVHIIKSVLDLKEKSVASAMTPMQHVFTLSFHSILDKDLILRNGYSRIPIKECDDSCNYIGMLLVKSLISYDVDDKLPVSHFQLSALPETFPETSCLDILNFFQEGKSHMAIVSSNPGGYGGALGVITLEDVIEGLIGEEIVDETDVFVDVHKKIKVNRVPNKRLQSIIPTIRVNTPPIEALNRTLSSESTGIKMRMKGYGAIVDSAGGGNSNALSSSYTQQQQQQQQNMMQNTNGSSEPKV
ncbi:cell agglutination protein Mam3 [Mucor atramentarius]